jgi:hypothetical protein
MLGNQIVSLASILLALAAVCVAAWQVRVSSRTADKSNALPVISEVFMQWRSPEFNKALASILSTRKRDLWRENFDALPRRRRQDAYKVCYFFDYLGTLVLYEIVDEGIIIGVMGSRLMQVWLTMKPLIDSERRYRLRHYPSGAPRGFLVYYEHLVVLIADRGGQDAAMRAQQRAGLLQFSHDAIRRRSRGQPLVRGEARRRAPRAARRKAENWQLN